jgi:AcrR family transcriptional regulator
VVDTATHRPGGRTARVGEAVLAATVRELVAHGVSAVSLDAIARRAGVSRATVYRRWGSRDLLVMAAVEWFGVAQASVPDTGEFDRDLQQWARSIQGMLADETAAALVMAVFTGDRAVTRPYRQQFWRVRLELVRPLVERAVERHELPPETDTDNVIRHLGAPLYYRFLVLAEPVTERDADIAAAATAAAARAGAFTLENSSRTVGRRRLPRRGPEPPAVGDAGSA